MNAYERSLALERRIYDDCLDVHRLPDIFHYWSERYIRPKIRQLGFEDTNNFFARSLSAHFLRGDVRVRRFVSLGSGNCDLEIELARRLRALSQENFVMDCVDVNEPMLERGRAAAAEAGFADRFTFVQADFNSWRATHEYDVAIANQSLHHVVNLEGLFDELKRSLRPTGTVVVSDMIGRNGHLRWPEALEIVHEFWRRLPPSYRFNRKLGIYEELFGDWDCSVEGFEGVRAQDILPLMVDRFHFHTFLPFGNVIDPFVDRAFGDNFDASAAWDRRFIDEVHARDERELAAGRLKPTHMMAVAGLADGTTPGTTRFPDGLSPRFCVRAPDERPRPASVRPRTEPYEWSGFPHDLRQELIIAYRQVANAAPQLQERTLWALRLQHELKERTTWALALERDAKQWKERAIQLDKELEERSAWALNLERELQQWRDRAIALESEFAERTEWALRLRDELDVKAREAAGLAVRARELDRCLHNPLHYLARVAAGAWKRIRNGTRFIRRDGSPESADR